MIMRVLDTSPPRGWEVTLNKSDLIGVIGTVVSLLGIAFGIYQMVEAKRARMDAKKSRSLLLRQQISQHFTGSATKALQFFSATRQRNWEESSKLGLLLFADLSNAAGFPDKLFGDVNKKNTKLAMELLGGVIVGLPLAAGETLESEQVQDLTRNCQVIFAYINAVEGALRLNTALGGDEDDQSDSNASAIEYGSIESSN